MDPVSATPAHALMQRKERDDHGPGRAEGAASAFSVYAFGPLQLPDGKQTAHRDEAPKGAPASGNPLKAPDLAWVTSVQGLNPATPSKA